MGNGSLGNGIFAPVDSEAPTLAFCGVIGQKVINYTN